MVSARPFIGAYAHEFLSTDEQGRLIVHLAALDAVLARLLTAEVTATYRRLAADYRDRACRITADAGAGEYTAAVFADLADELDQRSGAAASPITRRLDGHSAGESA